METRGSSRTTAAVVAAARVVLVVVGYLALSNRDTTGAAGAVPAGMTDRYAVAVGEDTAATTLTFYADPQCPVCAAFEAGDVVVEYRVVSFLDDASENDYSSRAANALMVVQEAAGPEAFAELHRNMFANQPAEGTAGPDDEQLVAWAVAAGADEADVRDGIESGTFAQFVANATDAMSQDGVNGTPSVRVDGQLVEGTPADALAAVREVVG